MEPKEALAKSSGEYVVDAWTMLLANGIVLGFLAAATFTASYPSHEQEIWYSSRFLGILILGVVLPAAALMVLRRSCFVIRSANPWMFAVLIGSLYFGAIYSGGV
jgi:uncharacterized membrane protein SirB2